MKPRRRSLLLTGFLAAVILVTTAIPATSPPATAEAAGPVAYAVGRFFGRVGSNLVHRSRDYREIGRNRDQALGAVAVDQQVRDYQRARGWLSNEEYSQQQQRNDSLRTGIVNLAEREKRITKYDYDHAFGREVKALAQAAVTSLPGLDPTAAKFVSNVIGGRDPLSAALSALQDPSKPYPDRLAAVQAQLGEAQTAFRSLRDHVRDPNGALKQELDRLKDESVILSDPGSRPAASELEQRVKKLEEELGRTRDAIKGAWKDLTGSDVKINQERFARDDKWLALNANVQALKDVTDVQKAVAAAMSRSAREKLDEALAASGATLSEEEKAKLVTDLAVSISQARAEARKEGRALTPEEIEKLRRDAIDRALTPPSPTGPTVTASPSPVALESPTAAPVPPTETPEPPTATPVPPTPTPVPPTATPVPPTPTPIPPTATPVPPTPTPTPKLPTITASGGFTDGNGFATTFTLTIDFKSGGVSGSIRGGKTNEWSVTCRDPGGNVIDVAQATETDSYQAGLAGGVGPDGGFSASFSGKVAATVQLTRPFTKPTCVGREPPLPAPSSSPIGGTLSGSATTAGAVSLSSSLGGSWSGVGGVQ